MSNNSSQGKPQGHPQGQPIRRPLNEGGSVRDNGSGHYTEKTTSSKPGTTPPPKK